MKLVPLRHVASVASSSVDKKSNDGELPVQLCNYTDVYKNDEVRPGAHLMRATATSDEIARFRLEVGDTVITKDSEDARDIGIAAFVSETAPDFVCGYHLAVIRPYEAIDPRFLYWALRSTSVLEHFSIGANGMTRFGLGLDTIRRAPIPSRSDVDQRRIADFLDDQVSRIDSIVVARHKQARLTSEEVRSELNALLTRVEFPRRPLQSVTDPRRPIQYGIVLPGPDFEGGVPIIKGGDIGSGRLRRLELNCTDPEIERGYSRSRVIPGDLVIAIRGSVGEVDRVPEELRLANLTQDSARIAAYRCDARWLWAALETSEVQASMAERMTGSTVRGINIAELRRVPIPVPDCTEQERLGGAAVSRRDSARRQVAQLERSIALFSEYKQALITAAVAGDLDVTTARRGIPA